MGRPKKISEDIDDMLSSSIGEDLEFYNDINKSIQKQFGHESDKETEGKFEPTGSPQIDAMISNNVISGGFPRGRISMICGESKSGKSALGFHILVEAQKAGNVAVLLDSEFSYERSFFERLGGDHNKLIKRNPSSIEQAFQLIESIINKSIEMNGGKKSDKAIVILWDSLVGTATEAELEADFGTRLYSSQAGLISPALRKVASLLYNANATLIMTNQLRVNLKAKTPYDPTYIIPGGEAPKFWSHVILFLKRKSKIQLEDKTIIGYETQAKLDKNRVSGDGGKFCNFDFYFNRGIDEAENIYDLLKAKSENEYLQGKFEIISTQQSKLILEDGTEKIFKNKEWVNIYKENKKYINDLAKHVIIVDLTNPNMEIEKIDDRETESSIEEYDNKSGKKSSKNEDDD